MVRHFCAFIAKIIVTKNFAKAKALIYRSLKALKSLGIVWYLRVRTEGADEFSRKLRGLKAV